MIPSHEKIIETKKCRLSGREFFVTDKDLEFYDKISPIFSGQKYSLPSPTLCPQERQKRRLSWRNDRGLSLSSQEGGLSMFNSRFGYTSYQPSKYWSDDWSSFDYSADFDFSKPTFPQLHILDKRVPKLARSMLLEENCDYVNQAGHVRDCYWVFEAEDSEKCYFGADCLFTKRSLDFLGSQYCEFCYEIIDCTRCNNVLFAQNCLDCRDSYFLASCFDCKNCFGCINLSKKEFCFFNEQLTKDEYFRRLGELSMEKHLAAVKDKVRRFFASQFFREHQNKKSENIFGDKVFESQNVYNSFDIINARDIHYCDTLKGPIHNCYDVSSFGINSSFCFECVTIGHHANNVNFCSECWENVTNLWYCLYCNKGIKDSFLCTGLKQKAEHCILNRPYSVQEYETLCGKIIDHMRSTGEWGEFFPHELSPFGYNETVAQEYFPMTEEEVRAKGWNWYTEEKKSFDGPTLKPLSIPEYDEKSVGPETAQKNIDTLLNGIILCEISQKPFKIIKQELAFYIENHLPIPTKHPDQRHKERMHMRNQRVLHERHCSECNKDIITTYSPDRPERVVCEECYRKMVF